MDEENDYIGDHMAFQWMKPIYNIIYTLYIFIYAIIYKSIYITYIYIIEWRLVLQ